MMLNHMRWSWSNSETEKVSASDPLSLKVKIPGRAFRNLGDPLSQSRALMYLGNCQKESGKPHYPLLGWSTFLLLVQSLAPVRAVNFGLTYFC